MSTPPAKKVCLAPIKNDSNAYSPYHLNEKFTSLQKDYKTYTAVDFASLYLPSWTNSSNLGFDPLEATYFELFDADPEQVREQRAKLVKDARKVKGDGFVDAILYRPKHHPLKASRNFDFRLNEQEKMRYQQHGMVVSERLGVESFAEGYYRLYTDDLPVFITADSILHAWHRSFDAILKEVETYCLLPTLDHLLQLVHDTLQQEQATPSSVMDTDYFLSIAQSLVSTKGAEYNIMPENAKRCQETLEAIERQNTMTIELFGKARTVDFSQFKPRGHYDSSEELKRYFKAMMWLGRIDFRLNGKESSIQQVRCAIVLTLLVRQSAGGMNLWIQFEKAIRMFIGPVDSMTISQLNQALEDMLSTGELTSMEQLWTASDEDLARIQSKLGVLDIGIQLVNSAVRETDSVCETDELPQSFTFLGQRFTLDSFAMSKSVYDTILWEDKKVQRRIPSGLDVAFSVFQNNDVAKEIVRRANDTGESSIRFRDGLPYVHSLAAIRKTMESISQNQWSDSIYSMWLNCIRQLSRSSPHASPTFHSEAWAMRKLTSQLASWTELKHDTVLYAKQSYTSNDLLCAHADVFVEPIPEFWTSVRKMAERSAALLKEVDVYDIASTKLDPLMRAFSPSRKGHVAFFEKFASIVEKLEQASLKLSKHESLTEEEVQYIKNVMEIFRGSGSTEYLGWYPQLFYSKREDSGEWDPLVTDIHTNTADDTVGDPGCIVHQGVGNVLMGLFSVNTGTVDQPKPMVFAGPVFSYYEFNMPIDKRMTDAEWRNLMRNDPKSMPAYPSWATSTYLVSGNNSKTKYYRHEKD